MKQSVIYKTACFLKSIFQVISSAILGWILAWWFLNAVACIMDKPDRAEEAADIKMFGWFMLVSGIITIATKEIVMYKINSNWKKYILLSIVPLVITSSVRFYYII